MSLIPLTINIVSDSICPFCFLGLRKVQGALAASPVTSGPRAALKPEIRFAPFQLDPTLPEDRSMVKRELYVKRFGDPERVRQMEEMMKARGKEEGINFSYGGNVRQTINSHRLIHRTLVELGPEKQVALVERLFAGYFEQERDPADPDMLAGAAVAVGLFPGEAEVRAYLAGTEDRAAVEKDIALAQRKRISGVPFFEIEAGGVGAQISGAQDREVFVDVFDKIARKLRELGKLPADGEKESGSDAQVDVSARKTDNATC